MKVQWLNKVSGAAAILLAVLSIICLASGAVYAANMVGLIDDLLGSVENFLEIFYVAAPVLLLVVWVGLYFVHRRQNKIMSLVALIIGVASTILCLIDVHFVTVWTTGGQFPAVEVGSIYAIGIRLPFFVLLIFGILGQKAEGMSLKYSFLTILLALGFAFSNLTNYWNDLAFLEACLFLLLAAWGLWLGILLWKGKLELK